jgi:hypothetical protein
MSYPDDLYSQREKTIFLEEFRKECFIMAADIITESGLSRNKEVARIAWNNIASMLAGRLFRAVEKLSNHNKSKLYCTYEEAVTYVDDSDWSEML